METHRHVGDASARSGTLEQAEFDELLREVLGRVNGVLDEQARLRLLLDAVVTMAADLTLDGVLARIVSVARTLADARYAALGVLGHGPDRRLRTFIHHGARDDQIAQLGELPTGHGLLGLIIDRPEPLRLHDIAEHAASYGFPANHPPMSSFLGVPVRIRDRVFGNLYLTEKEGGGDFTEQDENVVVALAAAAGVVIENARLYEEAATRERWLAATAEITSVLSRPSAGIGELQIVADRAREVSGADVAWIAAGVTPETLRVERVSGMPADIVPHDIELDHSLTRYVAETGCLLRLDDMANDARAYVPVTDSQRVEGPGIVVPLSSGSQLEGVLGLAWRTANAEGFYAVDVDLVATFAEQAALGLHVARAHDDQQRLAVLEERDRIGRDLHDLVIQRLFAVGLSVQGVARLSDHPEVTERIEQAVDDLDATIRDIRRSIFDLGSTGADHDIQTEVNRIVERAAGTLKFRPSVRFSGPVRSLVDDRVATDLLAVLGEALSNASRHAQASCVDVVLNAGDRLELVIHDDGRGLSGDEPRSGLDNMRQRAARHGGDFAVTSAPGQGTTVTWSVPHAPV